MWRNDKESTYRCKRHRFDPWVRKIPGVGNGNPLQYSCLGNPGDRGAWRATVHGITKSWTCWAGTHTHTHALNDSWVYSCYFCSFDRLYKALLLFKIYNQTLFNFALSSCSQIRSEKQIPEYNTTVFLGWGVMVDFSFVCMFLCIYFLQWAWVTPVIGKLAINTLKMSSTWSTQVLSTNLCSTKA